MIKAISTNISNKPKEIPKENWLISSKEYTINHIYVQKNDEQIGILSCTVDEVSLQDLFDKGIIPYNTYRLERFHIKREDLPKLKKLMEDCASLNDIDINKLLS